MTELDEIFAEIHAVLVRLCELAETSEAHKTKAKERICDQCCGALKTGMAHHRQEKKCIICGKDNGK